MSKTIKPRTQLLLDAGLFALVVVHLTAAVMVNAVFHASGPAYVGWHRALGFTGVGLALAVSVHLATHLPWIRLQVRRLAGDSRGDRPTRAAH